jgi:DNA repair exonuclease SbcCD nuclease subunit
MAKAFLISDIHLGVHQLHIDQHLEITRKYFFDFFFPLLKEHYKKGDKLFMLGDLFDNRTALDIKAICYCLDIFNWLEENEIEVHILLGNHDMRSEKSYEFNSLRILEKHTNVTIYSKPELIRFETKKILMMPFFTSHHDEKATLDSYKGQADYLFCHSDLQGAKNNINSIPLQHGLTIAEFVHFPKVFSGHIHLHQKIGNFTFIGSPYHLDRNDKGDQKGVYVIDIESGREKFIPNVLSPQYQTVEILKESDMAKIEDLMLAGGERNDWYDVVISNTLIIEKPELRQQLMEFTKKKKLAQVKQVDDIKIEDTVEDVEMESIGLSLSIPDLVRDYVRNQNFKEGVVKDKILTLLEEIIDTCADEKMEEE